MSTFDLYLHHGRKTPDEELEDWGPEGPRLKDVIGIHQTYGNAANVFFKDAPAKQAAQQLTGWEEWEPNALTMRWQDDMVAVKTDTSTMYFGDWGIIPTETHA